MASLIRRGLAIAAAIVAIVIAAEGFVRVLTWIKPVYDIEMIKYARDLKIPSPYPGLSHVHRPNSAAELMGVRIAFNSRGHRSPELSAEKPTGERRIYLIGSSMAMGWGVPRDQTFLARVVAHLNEDAKRDRTGIVYVPVNAGVGNYNAAYAVRLMSHQIEDVSPDLVVLQYFINDAEPDPRGSDSPLLRHSVLAAFLAAKFRQMGFAASNVSLVDYYAKLYEPGSETRRNAQRALVEAKRLASANGSPIVGVLIPDVHNLFGNSGYPAIYRQIETMFGDAGIPLLNTYGAIREAFANRTAKAWVAPDDPHPNAEAHGIIARELYRYIAGMKLQ